MNNILDLLNIGAPSGAAFTASPMGTSIPGIGAGSIPSFAPGAQQFGASTVPGISSNMSLSGIMPFVAQILGMRHPQLTSLSQPIVARPGQAINMRLAEASPGYASLFNQGTLMG